MLILSKYDKAKLPIGKFRSLKPAAVLISNAFLEPKKLIVQNLIMKMVGIEITLMEENCGLGGNWNSVSRC